MLDFKRIELSDKNIIDTHFAGNKYRACDFNFTNLYAWNSKFKSEYAISHHTIFIRFVDSDGQIYYLMPIGRMPLPDAFELIIADAKKNHMPFQLKAVTERMWNDIEAVMPGQFEYFGDRDNDEYIYLSEKLIKLSGKKLQSKRNHINRFKADNPDWQYYPITSQNEINECIYMLDQWDELNAPKGDKSLKYDYIATRIMLDNFDYLNLRGGCVKVNGKLVAFTIGEPLTEDTFVVHVEKAFGDINGAYTIINQQFIEHEASEFMYINREEDMGLESLRKAKMSYYPDILLHEAILRPKHDKVCQRGDYASSVPNVENGI